MDGRGRALDNIFVERLWRTVNYEYVYLHDIQTVQEAWLGLRDFFLSYNNERFHQSELFIIRIEQKLITLLAKPPAY